MMSRAFTSTRYSNRQPSRSRIMPLASRDDQRLLPTGSVPSVLPISRRRSRSSMSTPPGTLLNGLASSTWNIRRRYSWPDRRGATRTPTHHRLPSAKSEPANDQHDELFARRQHRDAGLQPGRRDSVGATGVVGETVELENEGRFLSR